ncbi:hypothetical protein NAF17_17860 [Mucilaginibacter sp. RB4R14]|uniref:hypothetical protein n=1 Tax=Mucilaginibacter aurantiaciroseus TaxID=2949308 RepID=UPI0020917722|nr:hypothetical protein [Mucilaginibacter aurantiaciroseus]MCO5937418.1 hypothetical protein [Mucilaginibacter aurantiaciroseus]
MPIVNISNITAMKIITLHKPVNVNELYNHINERLNPIFHKQKQSDISFTISNTPAGVEITQPEFYEGVLFTIAVQHDELWITRNEHYVDDVNNITVESILNSLFDDISNGRGTDLVQEG